MTSLESPELSSKEEHQHPFDDVPHQPHGIVSSPEAPAVARIQGLRDVYTTRSQLALFWISFGIWAVALNLSATTVPLYLAFATSYFQGNSLLSTIGLLTAIIGAVCQPFWGKLADITARHWCLAASILLYTLGTALSAGASSVQALAAGQVFYAVGNTGIGFLQTLIVGDTTPLHSRGLAYGALTFVALPFAFVSPNIASGIGLTHWRWGYGMFCIIVPVALTPILVVLIRADQRIKKLLSSRTEAGNQIGGLRRVWQAFLLVDPLGLVLLGFAFSLLLAPPTLAPGAQGGWTNPSMIAMEVVGGVIFMFFILWEWKLAAHPLFPRRILNRNYVLCTFTQLVQYMVAGIFNTYWSSWIWVVDDFSERQWTYICQAGTASMCAFCLIAGLIQRYVRRYKYMQITGNAVACLGLGLNFYSADGGQARTIVIVFAQILANAGAAIALVACQTASQASVRHRDLAIAIAVFIFVGNMGNGIGAAASGSIWSTDLVANLAEMVPSLNATDIMSIAGDITVARVAEPRLDIIRAYDKTYRKIAMAALIVAFSSVVTSCFCKDYDLDGRQNAVEDQLECKAETDPQDVDPEGAGRADITNGSHGV